MEPIIEIKNIGKRYNITGRRRGYTALREVITEKFKHPLLAISDLIKKITNRSRRETFWALKDINLEIQRGETVGIIGANGAGKSTLLKILTRITPPTTGEIKIKGKVASLLEVGTGFHPELTGRENVFLNGAILGMKRTEIKEKFDKIVAFSGIEKFIDTPVKRYSSGMYVRLAFSVAAHLEPDILLVDEVLAVGDAEFQKKCLGKMDEVTKVAGRTILFVSHNMGAIQKICSRCVLLEGGQIKKIGEPKEVIEEYLSNLNRAEGNLEKIFPFKAKQDIVVENFTIKQDGKDSKFIDSDKSFIVGTKFKLLNDVTGLRIGVYVRNAVGDIVARTFATDWRPEYHTVAKGDYEATLNFPARLLMPGNYTLQYHASRSGVMVYTPAEISREINVSRSPEFNAHHMTEAVEGEVLVSEPWQIKSV